MLFAIDNNNNRYTPQKNLHRQIALVCPCCKQSVLAKCGSVKSWHFSHIDGCECDPWSEMTPWHINWQQRFPLDQQEVMMGNHRADVVSTDGVVIEFQHSYLSLEKIVEREQFYVNMIWVIDAIDAFFRGDLFEVLKKETTLIKKFQWKRRKYIIDEDHGRCPMLLDIGNDRLIIVKKGEQKHHTFLEGKVISYADFIEIASTVKKQDVWKYFAYEKIKPYPENWFEDFTTVKQIREEISVCREQIRAKWEEEREEASKFVKQTREEISFCREQLRPHALIQEINSTPNPTISSLYNAVKKLLCFGDEYCQPIDEWCNKIHQKLEFESEKDISWHSLDVSQWGHNNSNYDSVSVKIKDLQARKEKYLQAFKKKYQAPRYQQTKKSTAKNCQNKDQQKIIIIEYEQIVDTSKMPAHIKNKYLSLQEEAQSNKWANTWVVWQCVKKFGEEFHTNYVKEIEHHHVVSKLNLN